MTATTKVPLGESVLARRWNLDVNTGTYANPVWTGVFGVEEFKAPFAPTVQDDADFDSAGWKSSTVSALAWTADLKVARKPTAAVATAYDPGQEVLRLAALTMGISNSVDVRWYEMTPGGPKVEAYRGYACVSWAEDGGAMDVLATVSVTLTGRGAATAITHPDGAAVVPVLYSVSPATGATGGTGTVLITGTGFMLNGVDNIVASTGIKFGATAATSWKTIDDNRVVAEVPAHAGGAVNVTVYNAVGVSISTCTFTYS